MHIGHNTNASRRRRINIAPIVKNVFAAAGRPVTPCRLASQGVNGDGHAGIAMRLADESCVVPSASQPRADGVVPDCPEGLSARSVASIVVRQSTCQCRSSAWTTLWRIRDVVLKVGPMFRQVSMRRQILRVILFEIAVLIIGHHKYDVGLFSGRLTNSYPSCTQC